MSHLVRFPTDEEIAFGLAPGFSFVEKFGRHAGDDGNGIDASDAPTDIIEGIATGLYTGFPAAAENFEVRSDSTDDDVGGIGAENVRLVYLANGSSTEYLIVDVPLDGTTWVDSGASGHRLNRIQVLGDQDNIGEITVRHITTPTNIFGTVQPGKNQSTIAAYTVPAGVKGILKVPFFHSARINGSAGSAEATLRIANTGGVFQSKRDIDITTDNGDNGQIILSLVAGDDIVMS